MNNQPEYELGRIPLIWGAFEMDDNFRLTCETPAYIGVYQNVIWWVSVQPNKDIYVVLPYENEPAT